jgi:ABC-type lipoprotein release transport system permease subunit
MTKPHRDYLAAMGKAISIALFILLAEASQIYLYACTATRDLARIGLVGPLAGALAGAAVALFLEQLWPRLNPFLRSVIFISIVVLFISAGTTYYQCYAEQITHDARILHPRAAYSSGAWGGDPWMMYPGLANAGLGTGCAHLASDVGDSLTSTFKASFIWLPVVLLISWFTTRNPAPRPRQPDLREALSA